MELISQKTKEIMEECKKRALSAGLSFKGESLEYIVTNHGFLELSPKVMIPTLYDFWADDVEIVRNKWLYNVYPHNPYETVINTRPPMSFYNDNNPDWLNVMIFYHVLGHIDFFQNNVFFRNTWNDDFCGQALADKRLINRIREEMGDKKRWVDYVIEFARGIDNLVGYYGELGEDDKSVSGNVLGTLSERIRFYFGEFLKNHYESKTVPIKFYYDEISRLNLSQEQFGQKVGEEVFFDDPFLKSKFPEFKNAFEKKDKKNKLKPKDILQYLVENSDFINKDENKWMKDILGIVRRTSLYFQPQIRTKNSHEGWASLWHERLFVADPRIKSHEVGFALTNSKVVVDPPGGIGLNPYIGFKRLYEFIEGMAMKGKLSAEYQLLEDAEARKNFDKKLGEDAGKNTLLEIRKNLNDSMLVNFLSDDDFQDFVDKHNLFVAGRRLNPDKLVIEIYIKSRSGREYRKMLNDSLYHPPSILINEDKSREGELYLDHVFEGRTLVTEYIPAVLMGLSYLAGNTISLETTEFDIEREERENLLFDPEYTPYYKRFRVRYTCKDKVIEKTMLSADEIGG